MTARITALIADDEPLMLGRARKLIDEAWPELDIVAECDNGLTAIERFEALQPQIAFLDIRMPGASGLEVAARIGGRAHVVFVTAYDEYAIEAFRAGAADYLLKPIERERLAETVSRLRARLDAQPAVTPPDLSHLLERLLAREASGRRLTWLRAHSGNTTRLIHIDDVLFFQSDTKYTRIVTRGGEWHVRTALKDLETALDPEQFWRIHRGTIVRVHAIERAVREDTERLVVHLRDHDTRLVVSRPYYDLFKES
jgi:DNA-binding LytR/AlgR family response regulator